MAMFGALAKKRGPFDFSPETYGAPGIGDGLPGAAPMGQPGLGVGMVPASAPSKFGVRDVIGIIGEALGGAAGNGPGAYTQMKLREREIARQQQLHQQQRRDGLADYATKQMIEARYAKPSALPDVIQLQTIADDPTQPANIRKAALDRVTALNDPIVNYNVGGRDFVGTRSQFLGDLSKGGDPSLSGGAGGSQSPAPSTGGSFMTVGQYQAMRQSMGAGYNAWSKKYGVPVQVTSPEEMAALPAGTPVVSSDGRRGVKK